MSTDSARASVARAAQAEIERRRRERELKLEAEQDLLAFVRMFWRTVEPETTLIEGMPLEAMCDFLMAVTDGHITRGIINIWPGSMKAADDDTPVLTTWGWKRHGDLQPDDFVFGPDGLPKRVLAVTSPWCPPCYAVRFDDGVEIIVASDHLWAVERDVMSAAPRWTRGRKTMVVPTTELRVTEAKNGWKRRPDRIAVARAISLPPRNLLIDPYVLGVWLGDGGSTTGCIYSGEQDIEHFRGLGRIAQIHEPTGGRKQRFYRIVIEGLSTKLRLLGLLGNKHIPDDYLHASIEQRWQLLRGLMDTDGMCAKAGACSFTNKNARLAEQVLALCWSLGLKASMNETYSVIKGERFGPYRVVGFTPYPGAVIFDLARKQARVRGAQNGRALHRYVASVTEVEPRSVRCIQVEGSLYLIGHALVTTHNSLLLNCFWPAWEWGPCRMPWLRYISASYSSSLTERDNIRFSRIIGSPVYKRCWGDVFSVIRDGQELVENNKTGWKRATSVGGTTAGHRGNRILIDDANNPNDIESKATLDSTNLWLREVMPDRLNDLDRDVIINLQQRTQENDATGTLAQSWRSFAWLCIPIEFDPLRICSVVLRRNEDGDATDVWTDPRSFDENGRQLAGLFLNARGNLDVRAGSPMAKAEGTLAWPERFSAEAIDEQRRIKGPFAFSGQYNQLPTARGGGIVRRDWWEPWTQERFPDFGTVIASLDTAVEENTQADYNALTIWGAFPGLSGEPKAMLINAWQDRLPLAQLVARVAELCTKHKADYLLIEHKTRGRDVHDEIRRIYATASWQTVLVKTNGDKIGRLQSVSHLFSGDVRRDPATGMDTWTGGMVYAPNMTWADEVIDQVANFPKGAHDDYVDSVSQALRWMRTNGVVLRKREYEDEEEERKRFKKTAKVPYVIR